MTVRTVAEHKVPNVFLLTISSIAPFAIAVGGTAECGAPNRC